MFIHPKQISQVLERHAEIMRARLIVDNQDHLDVMTLYCEVLQPNNTIIDDITTSLQAICKVKGKVVLEEPGFLKNDGKIIDDIRTYD